jgi:endoglucanase
LNPFETIKTLTQSPGPTGFETQAAETALKLLAPLVDEATIDCMGSVLGVKRCGHPNAPKVLLDAHLDEVGMIVTGYDKGYLRFATLGGIDPRVLPNREVTVLTNPPMEGIVAAKQPEDRDKAAPMSDLRIDVGLTQEEAQQQIPIGTPVVYQQEEIMLGEHQVAGKSLDDRSCCYLLLRTLELLQNKELDVDLYVLFSVREETDSTGAITAVYGAAPDCAVAVDVTFGCTPDESEGCFKMGGGPVLGVGPNITQWMLRRFKTKAKELDMPVQLEVMAGSTGTNGWDIRILREGIATAILSVPLKYMHTPVEVIHLEDAENCARLLEAFVEGIGEEELSCRSC